ncbi:MAG: hypothetical protein C4547_12430 [Phycisphaerales bacterium]|nr:MAG: hypothetical protein C4547_12430 [Phycisphaerales bacterium]
MAEGNSWFQTLYTELILRDLFGKIVPKAIALGALLQLFGAQLPTQAASLDSWPGFLFAGLAAGASWLTGFALQGLGEWVGLIRYFPSALDRVGWKTIAEKPLTDETLAGATMQEDVTHTREERYQEFLDDWRKTEKKPGQVQQGERFVVIKEACGNGFIALSLAIPLFVVSRLANAATVKQVVGLAVVVGITLCLREMHFIHVKRQFVYYVQVMRP